MQRLNEYEIVTINLPDAIRPARVSEFQCIVVALDESTAALEPLDGSCESLPRRAEHVLLAFEHNGRLVGLKGALTCDRAAMRFAVEDGVQIRRRRSTRVDMALPVTLRPRRQAGTCRGVTVNLAADGLLAVADLDVSTGDIVDISLELAEPHAPVNMSGTVVRHAEGLIAFRFVQHSAAMRSRLTNLVAEQQVTALGVRG
jgi:hypothetical protein